MGFDWGEYEFNFISLKNRVCCNDCGKDLSPVVVWRDFNGYFYHMGCSKGVIGFPIQLEYDDSDDCGSLNYPSDVGIRGDKWGLFANRSYD